MCIFEKFKKAIDNNDINDVSCLLKANSMDIFDDELIFNPFTYAISEHKNTIVDFFISSGDANLFLENLHEETPFFIAYISKNINAMNAISNKTNIYDIHLLEAGILFRDFKLIDKGINRGFLNWIDKDSQVYDIQHFYFTALHYAVYLNELEIAEYLVSRGADLNLKDDFQIGYLHTAIIRGYDNFFKEMILLGANPKQTGDGKNLLDFAKQFKRDEIVSFLTPFYND